MIKRDRATLLKELLELDSAIEAVKARIDWNRSDDDIFTLDWTCRGKIPIPLDDDLMQLWRKEKLKLAEKFLKLAKKQKVILEKQLKQELK